MIIWLLTHSEELKKKTGTGKLVEEIMGSDCKVITWSRVDPSQDIVNLSPDNSLLIYPNNNVDSAPSNTKLLNIENIIVIDGTWQQARKMYNQSPYLKKFTHYEIKDIKSVYSKRRNQKTTGLCTAEVAIHLLNEYNHPLAPILQSRFTEFNQ
ncbi:tRNA-uridine aminocarboxypropyltransferase [Marinomonas foliarum]|uniref:tRNA-uridine aminocarboxypropyltransferase n=1 Tax=Marinomonas foliarum TaxID=491950 RepID=A0A368ZKB5_9GAMM|nr:tRNA-uridine aminocarboxypropyltransferase [Marinomonas foliarum]RCW94378.1 DTW domain-containing protein [Marinomonas foliarum]